MKLDGRFIRNFDFPPCKNCVYYRPSGFNHFASPLNKCEKFGTKDVVTDEIAYNYTDICRSDEDLCGKSGKYHVKEPRFVLKRLKHAIFRPITFFYITPVVYLVAYCIKFISVH